MAKKQKKDGEVEAVVVLVLQRSTSNNQALHVSTFMKLVYGGWVEREKYQEIELWIVLPWSTHMQKKFSYSTEFQILQEQLWHNFGMNEEVQSLST